MENYNELYHHGIKGMKWGIRRYQNKDGSLTPKGKKRRSLKQVIKDHKTAKKRKEALEKARQVKAEKKVQEQTLAEKKAKILNSTDPKEIYENRHLLTYNELNDRVNRINLESNLANKIPQEQVQTGLDKVNSMMRKTSDTINNATNLYKKVDDAYTTVTNSGIGKALAKKLGFEPPEKEFDLEDFMNNFNKKSTQEIMDVNKRLTAQESIMKKSSEMKERENAEAKLKEYQKQVDDYVKNGAKNDSVKSNVYNKTSDDIVDNKTATGKGSKNRILLDAPAEKVEGKVEWVDKSKASKYKEKVDTIIDGEFRDVEVSGVPVSYTSRGENFIAGLLEDKSR